MRVAYCVRAIFPQHGYGGLERSASGLLRALLAEGVDVALFTQPLPQGNPVHVPANSPGRLTVHTVRYGILPLPPNGIPARLTNYRAFVEDMGRRVGALALRGHLQGIYAHGLCAWGVRSAGSWGVPMLANPHGMEEFKVQDPLKRLAYAPFREWIRAGCRAADRVVSTDHAMRGEVSSLLGVSPENVVVLPNGIDLKELSNAVQSGVQAELRLRWPTLSDATVMHGISVGRLEANKGFRYLLDALGQVREATETNWEWFVVGEGSQRTQLEQMARQMGIADRVVFTGSLSDPELHSLYSLCNLFAHPTLYEGSSLVTLEAMAHGLPVVASAVGGIPDKVVDGETGFLVAPSDSRALAERLTWLMSRPTESAHMGRRGRARVERLFTWQRVAADTAQLFRTLLAEKAACGDAEVAAQPC
jgi:glycogen synthase